MSPTLPTAPSRRSQSRRERRRVVIISNRVPATPESPAAAGGLVSAIVPGLERHGGLWLGTSGRIVEQPDVATAHHAGVEYVVIDLTPDEQAGYCEGFSNTTLWPLMHGLEARAASRSGDYAVYRSVARRLADIAMSYLEPEDVIWVHDYQLFPLGQELRRAGWQGTLGFFLHIPVPLPEGWQAIPHAEELAAALTEYDLVGVQTDDDAERLRAIIGPRDAAVRAYPVTIDADSFRALAGDASYQAPAKLTDRRQLIFGIDRLDYTKGIPQRLEGFERLLERRPDLRGSLFFTQWAVASRDTLEEYRRERLAVDEIAARIKRRWGPHVLVAHRNRPRADVAAALSAADVAVVTPVADGMNLVAKEFAAVHDAKRPGVLVLSEQCGAAHELKEAVFVRGGDPESISGGLERAVEMGTAERSRRSAALRRRVDAQSAGEWFDSFVRHLERVTSRRLIPASAVS